MIWFSSDWHLNHLNIAGKEVSQWEEGYRDFSSVEEMNETIIKTINKYVKPNDILYFLGDFCFKDHRDTPKWRSRINCQDIRVCRGNHDHHIDKYRSSFSNIQDVQWFKGSKDHQIFMSHYSHRVWEGSHKGYIHLYGHSHDTIKDYGRSMDVGVDVAYRLTGEYRPFSLDEIIQIMEKRDPFMADHHTEETNVK